MRYGYGIDFSFVLICEESAMPTLSPRKNAKTAAPAKNRQHLSPKTPALAPKRAPVPITKTSVLAEASADRVTLSRNGRVLGRPRLERAPLAQVQTRVPSPLSDYLKMLSIERLPDQPGPFRTMQRMFETLFARFLDEQPWTRGLAWRESHAVARFTGGELSERTHWKQLNIQLPVALAQRVETTAKRLDRSQSSFCYTALCWWAGMLYPPVANRAA
jgi:hypothetical protein